MLNPAGGQFQILLSRTGILGMTCCGVLSETRAALCCPSSHFIISGSVLKLPRGVARRLLRLCMHCRIDQSDLEIQALRAAICRRGNDGDPSVSSSDLDLKAKFQASFASNPFEAGIDASILKPASSQIPAKSNVSFDRTQVDRDITSVDAVNNSL